MNRFGRKSQPEIQYFLRANPARKWKGSSRSVSVQLTAHRCFPPDITVKLDGVVARDIVSYPQ